MITIKNFVLMESKKTENGLNITKEALQKAYDKHMFDNKPVVFNENGSFKDYLNNDIVNNFINEKCIGFIEKGTVRFDGNKITGTIHIRDDIFKDRKCYDNWCIEFEKSNNEITSYDSCELFSN